MTTLQKFIHTLSDHLQKNNALQKIINKFRTDYSLIACIGVEIEFYLSKNIDPLEFQTLLGIAVKKEKGANQFEVDLPPSTNIIEYIEKISSTKSKIQIIAEKLRGNVNFSAKPFASDYGNSMHFHVNFIDSSALMNNRLLAEFAAVEEFIGDTERKTAAYSSVREDLSTGSTYKLPTEVELCKKSNVANPNIIYSFVPTEKMSFPRRRESSVGCHSHESGNLDPCLRRDDTDVLDLMGQSICHYMLDTFLIFMPNEDDYLRLDKNFMAPTNVSFGNNNRTVALRTPDLSPKRLEHRIANPLTDPYLAIFTILNSIFLGLKFPDKINNINKIYGNAFDQQYNLVSFPKSLTEALELFNLEFFIYLNDNRQRELATLESLLEIMKKL
ncbi:palindromic element RPE1 domain-containing protein [Candidatus Tisiphia endosymbiont of Ditula angustiorana]|uniref:palindromic element RPE1 domain-containing protein n=1 Tax=Candidatus Tisiphia endosymbiont of Ditula angustiorana TaxID=3066272 RepID=UPI00312CA7D1